MIPVLGRACSAQLFLERRSFHAVQTVIAVSFLALSACATSTNVTSGNAPEGEALVVGKMQVSYNGDDVTSKIYLNFKNSAETIFKIDVENGFFFAHLPAGSYELQGILFIKLFAGDFEYRFQPGRGTFEVPAASQIYDLGRITIVWNGPAVNGTNLGLVGALVDIARGNGDLTIAVSDDSVEVSDAYLQRFGSRPSMVNSPIKVTNP